MITFDHVCKRCPDGVPARSRAQARIPSGSTPSPSIVNVGGWDALGKQGKADYFAGMPAATPPGASAPRSASLTASCSP